MQIKYLIAVSIMVAIPITSYAAPVDLQPVSATRVHKQFVGLAKTLELYHPYLKSIAARKIFKKRVRHLITSIHGEIPTWKDWLLQQKLVRSLSDPHTAIYPLFIERRVLPIKMHWVSDGILVSPWANKNDKQRIPKDSQLLRLGNYGSKSLLRKLKKLFSGPPEWLKVSHVLPSYEMYWLGVVKPGGTVNIAVRTSSGKVRHIALKFITQPRGWFYKKISKGDRKWYHWWISRAHNIGWFTLNKMRVTPDYDKAVAAFFKTVEKAHITRVAIDLRENGGGSSLAEVPFMQYMGVKHYRDYGDTISLDPKALDKQFEEHERYLKENIPKFYIAHFQIPKAPPVPKEFRGRLYLVTGPGCFSSAMEFAADIKYNHIGKIIGEPCGEPVTGPGEVREFIHHSPSGVPFQVSTTIYQWPGLASGAVVEPDIRIPLTMSDVRRGIDPVKRWFYSSEGAGYL